MVNIFDIEWPWHLVWIVPLAIVTGFGLYAIFGGMFSRNPEGPPYANFDERLDAHMQERGIEPIDTEKTTEGPVWFDPIMGEFVRTPKAGHYPLPKDDERRRG